MKRLVPAFLLLALGYLATAEVVGSFTGKCDKFFAKGIPPTTALPDNQYKRICQMRSRALGYEFATLYDTSRRIPVYSAYKFEKKGACNRTTWYIEPQLDDQNGAAIMASENTVRCELRGQKQALNEDYINTGYDRGHLVPVLHRNFQSCVLATFTLTNAAPQHQSFNRGQWKKMEYDVSKLLTTDCLDRNFYAYIVTGVVPGETAINGMVNVPSYFWSAYCCIDNNGRPRFSGAFYGYNNVINRVASISTAVLDASLARDYGSVGFQVFSDKCIYKKKTKVLYVFQASLLFAK